MTVAGSGRTLLEARGGAGLRTRFPYWYSHAASRLTPSSPSDGSGSTTCPPRLMQSDSNLFGELSVPCVLRAERAGVLRDGARAGRVASPAVSSSKLHPIVAYAPRAACSACLQPDASAARPSGVVAASRQAFTIVCIDWCIGRRAAGAIFREHA